MIARRRRRRIGSILLVAVLAGCQAAAHPGSPLAAATSPAAEGLAAPLYLPAVRAVCVPPAGWRPDAPEGDRRHSQQVWISPSGRTAYGVIHFNLPLPVGPDLALWAFMSEMRRSEGEAALLSRQHDPNLGGIRFVAEGGKYTVRTNLVVRGFEGWAIYAGTLRAQPVAADELLLAERARERTEPGGG